MNFYISDTHWDHGNIMKYCDRPFATVEEMNQAMIENWNRKVGDDDDVYIVGDMFFYARTPVEYMLCQLKGRKHLIIGNHDCQWMKKVEMAGYFESVQYVAEIKDGKRDITLCHYPMMAWHGSNHGSYLIYGHIHNNTGDFFWPLLRKMENALNAGVDVNHFEPVTFEELVENNRRFRASKG